jgi:hypothetical protein
MQLGRVLAVAVASLGLAAVASTAEASDYPAGAVGHDVSYPQCTSAGATTTTVGGLGGAFGVVGVTGGRPYGANSCSTAEYTWASSLPSASALYMNTANPAPTSSFYWPASGTTDPALCLDASSKTDPGCAYDYGWHAAADALTHQAANIPTALTATWWLDVETGNSWNGDGASNAADLQGAFDYLRNQGVGTVGIYSTSYQWQTITGGYNPTNTYASRWASEFTAMYPMTGSPVWIAGVGSLSNANTACASAGFAGGPVWLAQYADGSGYDADVACSTTTPPPAAEQSFTISLSPTSGSVKRSGHLTTNVTIAESGASQTVALTTTGLPSGVTAAFTPQSLNASGTSSLRFTIASGTRRGTYAVTVNATGSTGSRSVGYALTVR